MEEQRMGATVAGAGLWVAVVGGGWVLGAPLPLVEALLALALLVLVPTALPLLPRWSPAVGRGGGPATALLAGAPAAIALVLPPGAGAALLAVPWLGFAVVLAARAPGAAAGDRRVTQRLARVAAPAFLVVGALWLLADRAAVEPAGFGPPYVLLTAVHFHHAGFLATVLTAAVERWSGGRTATGALLAVISGPPLVAAGFAAVPALQIIGAVVLTAGLLITSAIVLRQVVPPVGGAARVLLATSAVAVIVPMALAVQWAVGYVLGTPALSIPAMARWHGAVNAIGYGLAGVLGWRVVLAEPRDEPRGRTGRRTAAAPG
jgi:hypothetical protein